MAVKRDAEIVGVFRLFFRKADGLGLAVDAVLGEGGVKEDKVVAGG